MNRFTRRQWIAGAMASPLAAQTRESKPLDIGQYQPKSMLTVKETRVERARFPVIDIHTHLSYAQKAEKGVPLSSERRYLETPENLLAVMDRKNLRALVNLTGGWGQGLKETIARYDKTHPGRFYTFTEPSWHRINDPAYPKLQAETIRQAHDMGARGLKVLKTLGLYLRENVTSGNLIKIDDPRFDPMWEACGALQMPVCIHIGDPAAFFTATDRFNERFEELNHHPDWSFHGKDFPPLGDLIAARDRVISRHPKTQFVVLHVGNHAEDLAQVGQSMDRQKNMNVEIGARIGELGRQPRASRKFFDRYQDRILFGTDATPKGTNVPQQLYGDRLYEIYFRFLETEDEYFDYAPADVPPQGRWKIYGLGLPEAILRKVYNANAARLLGVKV